MASMQVSESTGAVARPIRSGGRRQHGVWRVIPLALSLLWASTALQGCGGEVAEARFQLTVTVRADGVEKAASTIWQVIYFWGGNANGKAVVSARGLGVAAVIDLGPHGTLVVPRVPHFLEWKKRKTEHGLICPEPLAQTELFQAAIHASDTSVERTEEMARKNAKALPSGPVRLNPRQYPAFVWFPAGQSYKAGKQLCPEEFAEVIGAPVSLQSVTVQAEPDAEVVTTLAAQGIWLETMRADKAVAFSPDGSFRPYIEEYEGPF